jgi:hypothetical protein
MSDKVLTAELIKKTALELGADLVGVAPVARLDDLLAQVAKSKEMMRSLPATQSEPCHQASGLR